MKARVKTKDKARRGKAGQDKTRQETVNTKEGDTKFGTR
jgi:hypothetical protein